MTHLSEHEFADLVEEWLIELHGAGNVLREEYLSETGRFADFLVTTAITTWAIEVENDADSIVEATGQSILYASHHPAYRPAIVVPAGHVDHPEREMLEQYVRLFEFDVAAEEITRSAE